MSRHRFGQGNGPTRAKTLRANRRTDVSLRTEEDRDIGIRTGVVERLGLDGERHLLVRAPCGCELPPERVMRHSAWRWMQRDPVTHELPFGVW